MRKVIHPYEIDKYLRDHGVDYLTSEADGTGLRGLYDLTPEGEEIITEFFGGCRPTYAGMNNYPGKGCMIPGDAIRSLVIYILMRDGFKWVYAIDHDTFRSFVGYDNPDEFHDVRSSLQGAYPGGVRSFIASGTAMNGLRNRHEMSGRVE